MSEMPARPVQPTTPQAKRFIETADRAIEDTDSEPIPELASPNSTLISPAHGPVAAGTNTLHTIGDYVVIRQIGEGGMGSVYLAKDTRLNRKVALKKMKPEFAADVLTRDRFVREARATAAIESDYIVSIWGVGEATDGTPFIAMPYLQGEALDSRLKREPIAPIALILKVACETAQGLVAAHTSGLIHRDIKPGNIWLEGDLASPESPQQVRRCKILDFGLARSVSSDDVQITTSGMILGTPAFMAPEQARGERVDHRADLFSLGAMLYRMATGKLPFDGPTPMAMLIALTTDTSPAIHSLAPHLPPKLAALIDQLMCKNAGDRPQSATEVVVIVREIIKDCQELQTTELPTGRSFVASSGPKEPPSRDVPLLKTNTSQSLTLPDNCSIVDEPKLSSRSSKKGTFWILLSAIGFLALIPLGLWLSGVIGMKQPATNVEKKEETPTVDSPKNAGPGSPGDSPQLDPDRQAALRVIAAGGSVYVDGMTTDIKSAKDLPKDAFQLTGVYWTNPAKEADWAVFGGCKNITLAYLSGSKITNAGLTQFKECKNLATLDLSGAKVDDDSVALIKQFTKLKDLSLILTDISKKGAQDIAKALPQCRLQTNDGTIEPKK